MISSRLAAALQARGVHYGWVVVGVTFLVMLATAGAMGASGVILEPLQREFGWANADISFALAVRLLLFGLMGPFAAAFINRFGVRAVVAFAVALITLGILGTMAMREVWHLLLFWGVVVGLGTGIGHRHDGAGARRDGGDPLVFRAARSGGRPADGEQRDGATGVPAAARRRHAAMGLARGARPCRLPAGGGARAGPGAAARPAVRSRPGAVRRTGDRSRAGQGRHNQGAAGLAARRIARSQRQPGVLDSRHDLLRLRALAPTASSRRIGSRCAAITASGPSSAAGILAAIGAFDFVGTILSGWLSDRFDNRWLLFFYYGLRGLSLIYLPYTAFSIVSLSLFGVFYGLDWVATVPPTVRLSASAFGAERANITFGWIFAAHQIGAACAAFGAGVARTNFSSYLPALYVAGAACLAASALIVTLAPPRRRRAALA